MDAIKRARLREPYSQVDVENIALKILPFLIDRGSPLATWVRGHGNGHPRPIAIAARNRNMNESMGTTMAYPPHRETGGSTGQDHSISSVRSGIVQRLIVLYSGIDLF